MPFVWGEKAFNERSIVAWKIFILESLMPDRQAL